MKISKSELFEALAGAFEPKTVIMELLRGATDTNEVLIVTGFPGGEIIVRDHEDIDHLLKVIENDLK